MSTLIFGESSISDDEAHRPVEDGFAGWRLRDVNDTDTEDEDDEVYYRQMYRAYLNMTKAVKHSRWTFEEYRAVLAKFR